MSKIACSGKKEEHRDNFKLAATDIFGNRFTATYYGIRDSSVQE